MAVTSLSGIMHLARLHIVLEWFRKHDKEFQVLSRRAELLEDVMKLRILLD